VRKRRREREDEDGRTLGITRYPVPFSLSKIRREPERDDERAHSTAQSDRWLPNS
jgi:hypothetical protein